MNTVTMSAIIVTLFLGGPRRARLDIPAPDWLGAILWFFLKLFVFLFMYVWFRATLPRFRYDQLMDLGWKVLIPLALRLAPAHRRAARGPRRGLERRRWSSAHRARRARASRCGCCSGRRWVERRATRPHEGGAVLMGYLEGFLVTLPDRCSAASGSRPSTPGGIEARRATTRRSPKPERLHGRHVLNRYEDGMEKCIGCELCAGVCPARCIYVRGADNPPDDPVSARASATASSTRSTTCAASTATCASRRARPRRSPRRSCSSSRFTNRRDAIYTKDELLVDDDGKPQQLPWEDWREGDDAAHVGLDAGHGAVAATPTSRAWWRGRASSATACARPSRPATDADAATGSRRDREAQVDRGGTSSRDDRRGARTDGRCRLHRRRPSIVLGGALGVVLRANPVHCGAQPGDDAVRHRRAVRRPGGHFLAAVQVIVYAGAIVVLFLFVIMLLGVDRPRTCASSR